MVSTWGQLNYNLRLSAREKKIPLVGAFELTSRCNLECKMCYIRRPASDQDALTGELTAKEWISLAKEARDAGMLYLLLTGGEVFLRPDFRKICEEIASLGIVLTLYTNATLITADIAKWLKKVPVLEIGVTIYGASRDTYERVCGNPNGYDLTLKGIDLLLSEDIPFYLKTTIIRDNYLDFFQLADFAGGKNLNMGIVNYISPRREGNNTFPQEERLSPVDLNSFLDKAHIYLSHKKELRRKSDKRNDVLLENLDESIQDSFLLAKDDQDPFRCSAGKYLFWLTWSGQMTPCGLMAEPFTYPLIKGFRKAWLELQDLCKTIPICTDCVNCENYDICFSCPARLKNETGYYNKIAPYLCQIAKNFNREVAK